MNTREKTPIVRQTSRDVSGMTVTPPTFRVGGQGLSNFRLTLNRARHVGFDDFPVMEMGPKPMAPLD